MEITNWISTLLKMTFQHPSLKKKNLLMPFFFFKKFKKTNKFSYIDKSVFCCCWSIFISAWLCTSKHSPVYKTHFGTANWERKKVFTQKHWSQKFWKFCRSCISNTQFPIAVSFPLENSEPDWRRDTPDLVQRRRSKFSI